MLLNKYVSLPSYKESDKSSNKLSKALQTAVKDTKISFINIIYKEVSRRN